MRRILLVLGLILVTCAPTMAQDTPLWEAYGGYAYVNADPTKLERTSLHGWNATVNVNVNDWFGIEADFGGYYGSRRYGSLGNVKLDSRIHTFTFGPRLTLRKHERVNWYMHALFGAAKGSAEEPTTNTEVFDDSAFAGVLGGGGEYKVSDRWGIRVGLDYIWTRFDDPFVTPRTAADQHNLRLTVGVVFGGGKK
jgi:hypothetical protein